MSGLGCRARLGRLEVFKCKADFQSDSQQNAEVFRSEGGVVPLVIWGVGWIGSLVVSGLGGREGHALGVASVARLLRLVACNLAST